MSRSEVVLFKNCNCIFSKMTEYRGFCHPQLSGMEEACLQTIAPVTGESKNSDSHRGVVGDPGLLEYDVT
jgi:hypothetical protein